ncbi:MAG: sigma-70 family RNA polymerase sigma factor [Isosphaeraceae bacterium]
MPDDERPAQVLESYRCYLMLLASARIDTRLRAKLDPADLVQQALARALAASDRFRGDDEQLARWLRTILGNVLIDAARKHLGAGGRGWERSLEQALEQSSARLEAFLASDSTSPSGRAERNERLKRLADALGRLPEDQRDAVRLRHLEGLAVNEIAGRMGRTEASVAGLLRRGLGALRHDLGEP